MNKKIIELSSVSFRYKKRRTLLEDLNLSLECGRIHGLLGKNGEGKSTLMKLIGGLLFSQKGKISALGYQPEKRQSELLREIYFLPEELPSFSVSIKNFEKMHAPFYPNFSTEQFNAYLKEFDIESKEG